MGKTVRIGWLVLVASVCVGFASSSASAYTMSLLSGGANEVTLDPGDLLTVDLVVSNPIVANGHDGNDLVVSFDRDGVGLEAWRWASPDFVTGGSVDFTRIGPAPAPSGAALLASLPQPTTSAYGIHFAANTDSFGVLFGTGTVLSFDLVVPASTPGRPSDDVMLDVSGSFTDFVETFEEWDGVSTGPFTLHITPEPATLMLLGLGGLGVLRRRRSA